MNTTLTQLLGITYPILQGAMVWISESRLTSAVSNAGGAGIIAAGGRSPEWVRQEISQTKKLTNKPFGINVPVMDPKADDIIEVICREKVSFITLGAGNPVPFIEPIKKAGIKVIPIVPNVKLAKRMEAMDADAIIIEGMESGGHIGTLTTMALLTNVIPEVKLPVVAAGGIIDGRGIAAALIMGAAGVQMGSRFMLTEECTVNPRVKEMIINANDTDSVVTGYLNGHRRVRGIRNKFTDHYIELERIGTPEEELDKIAAGTSSLAAIHGDIENGMVQAGQSLIHLNSVQPVAEVIQELVNETVQIITNAQTIVR